MIKKITAVFLCLALTSGNALSDECKQAETVAGFGYLYKNAFALPINESIDVIGQNMGQPVSLLNHGAISMAYSGDFPVDYGRSDKGQKMVGSMVLKMCEDGREVKKTITFCDTSGIVAKHFYGEKKKREEKLAKVNIRALLTPQMVRKFLDEGNKNTGYSELFDLGVLAFVYKDPLITSEETAYKRVYEKCMKDYNL